MDDRTDHLPTPQTMIPTKKTLFGLFLITACTSFAGGLLLGMIIFATPLAIPHVTTQTTPTPPLPTPGNNFTPTTASFHPRTGKRFFNDTIMLLTTSMPRRVVAATLTRKEEDNDTITHDSRVSFFDGNTWERKTERASAPDMNIGKTTLIPAWSTTIDSSRVLKEQSTGTISFGTKSLAFQTGVLGNEMTLRSLPGYTKFISRGLGTVTIDGKSEPAHVLYTRIYSMNVADIQFYDNPFGITTVWGAVWGQDGSLYHVDTTTLDKPTDIYGTHAIGFRDDGKGTVARTFDLQVANDTATTPPKTYEVTLGSPINATLTLDRQDALDKEPGNDYIWITSNVTGTIKHKDGSTVPAFGLVEYIHK